MRINKIICDICGKEILSVGDLHTLKVDGRFTSYDLCRHCAELTQEYIAELQQKYRAEKI